MLPHNARRKDGSKFADPPTSYESLPLSRSQLKRNAKRNAITVLLSQEAKHSSDSPLLQDRNYSLPGIDERSTQCGLGVICIHQQLMLTRLVRGRVTMLNHIKKILPIMRLTLITITKRIMRMISEQEEVMSGERQVTERYGSGTSRVRRRSFQSRGLEAAERRWISRRERR
jgi:hypothetical protein